jgi:FKBP-type peptidyl-prolyl cis-trans isomerase
VYVSKHRAASQLRVCAKLKDQTVSASVITRRQAAMAVGSALVSFVDPESLRAEDDAVSNTKDTESGTWAEHEGPFTEDFFLKFKSSPSGLRYFDQIEGNGQQPALGETVRLHYSGFLMDGTKFDSSYRAALFPFSLLVSSAPPVAFKLEKGSLIPGFLEAVLGMKTGGRRIVRIPSSLAYGEKGASGVIPPNSSLVFFIELRRIGSGLSL